MTVLDPTHVRESLRRLSEARLEVFGAIGHRFLLNPPLEEPEVISFEERFGIRLPADFRTFITNIGNGGAGPYYGVFPLGKCDGASAKLESWSTNDGFVGLPSEPFPFKEPWNDLRGMPDEQLREENEGEYTKQYDEFERRYCAPSIMNGAIPICEIGCALRVWLVVTGLEAQHVWYDGRADYSGLRPIRLKDGTPATFSGWYAEWLDNALRQAHLVG